MMLYILKSILCLGLLWGFYKVFLEHEKIHQFKRFYLLGILVLSAILPTVVIEYNKEISVQSETLAPLTTTENVVVSKQADVERSEQDITEIPLIFENEIPLAVHTKTTPSKINYYSIGTGLYLFVLFILLFRFGKNLSNMYRLVCLHPTIPMSNYTAVLLAEAKVPYTFLHYIFVKKTAFELNTIPAAVLLHEQTHVRQKHTWDILLIEIFQVVFWFNPFVYLLKKSVRLNHEFLADQQVLKEQFSLSKYIQLLVQYPNSSNQAMLASPINYSLTKKRLQMMTQNFSKKRALYKLLAVVPLIGLCILVFNQKVVAKEVLVDNTTIPLVIEDKSYSESKGSINSEATTKLYSGSADILKSENYNLQEGISPKEVKAYKRWVRKVERAIKKGMYVELTDAKINTMQQYYGAMSLAQRNKVRNISEVIEEVQQMTRSAVSINQNSMVPVPPLPTPPPSVPGTMVVPPIPPVPPVPSVNAPDIPEEFIKGISMTPEEIAIMEEEIAASVEAAMQETEAEMEANLAAAMEEAEEALEISIDTEMEAMEESEIRTGTNSGNTQWLSGQEQIEIRKQALEEVRQARSEALERAREARREALDNAHEVRRTALEEARDTRTKAHKERQRAHEIRQEVHAERQKILDEHKKMHEKNRQQHILRHREQNNSIREQVTRAKAAALRNRFHAREHAKESEKQASLYTGVPRKQSGTLEHLREMDRRGATFYYKRKEITVDRAIKIVKNAGDKFAISTKTQNGVSIVKIRD